MNLYIKFIYNIERESLLKMAAHVGYAYMYGDVATYTIIYIYVQSIHSCAIAPSYVAFIFFLFSVCRIHVILDNFTIWCTAIVSASQ